VLEGNWRDGYTLPSPRLYPFQWNWDSGFIALGLAYLDAERALEEVRSMFLGQWSNGMLPHINFHKRDANYFPGPELWRTDAVAERPIHVRTSGISQPPVFGFILERMAALPGCQGSRWQVFLAEIVPKIISFHRYLYTQRDPADEGLVYIHHNWEAGTDNSPLWDDILAAIDVTGVPDVAQLRRDIQNVAAPQRPTNENYSRYIHLVDLFARLGYDDAAIARESPFLVQDVLFNSLLVRSNMGLIGLCRRLGWDTREFETWNRRTIDAINRKLWDEASGHYYAYDLRAGRQIRIKTSSGLAPLFAGICSPTQAGALAVSLESDFRRNPEWRLCPSVAVHEPSFDPVKYWRGPVWVNLNWMLYHGLRRYGFEPLAARLKSDTLQLIERLGMYEYFDPRPAAQGGGEQGLGAEAFSWTAALYLDLRLNDAPF